MGSCLGIIEATEGLEDKEVGPYPTQPPKLLLYYCSSFLSHHPHNAIPKCTHQPSSCITHIVGHHCFIGAASGTPSRHQIREELLQMYVNGIIINHRLYESQPLSHFHVTREPNALEKLSNFCCRLLNECPKTLGNKIIFE